MSKNITVMFAGSQGGHYKELMGLRSLFARYQSVLVTDNQMTVNQTNVMSDFIAVELSHAKADNRAKNAGRISIKPSRWHEIGSYIKMFVECFRIYHKYHPSVVVSTGSYIAVPLFICAKIYGAKTIFIESNAKVYSKTTTGILVEKLSDKIYVQWPEMLKLYPEAEYYGVLH